MDKISAIVLKIKQEIPYFFIFFVGMILVAFLIYYYNSFFILVRFKELGPLTKNMSAYYNGFKIGRVIDIEPDRDFKHTLAKVNIGARKLNLPNNVTVGVEKFPNGELYLQFYYPQSPSLRNIRRGDIIEGIAPYSLEQFMLGQSISNMTDMVSIHIIKALNAADVANQQMQVFFKSTSKMIDENQGGIKQSVDNTALMTQNLAQMAQNLNEVSRKLNSAIDENELKSTAHSAKEVSENVALATKDLQKTVEKIDETIAQANSTAKNLNSITSGLNETMGQRFAGMKLLFGKPVKHSKVRHACK